MVTTNYQIGSLGSGAVQRSTFLNQTYDRDIYNFTISGSRNINLHLFGMQADGDDADLKLYRDSNNNGVLDSGDQWLSSSSRSSNQEESINYQAGSGRYFAVVDRYRVGGSSLPYRLNLSSGNSFNSERASNLLPNETNVGTLTRDRTFSDSVGNTDTTDTYSFSLGNFAGVNIRLNGLRTDADIRLIQDRNGNRIVDAGEVIRTSANGGISAESINGIDQSGNYYLQVYQYSGNTSYNVTFDHYSTPWA